MGAQGSHSVCTFSTDYKVPQIFWNRFNYCCIAFCGCLCFGVGLWKLTAVFYSVFWHSNLYIWLFSFQNVSEYQTDSQVHAGFILDIHRGINTLYNWELVKLKLTVQTTTDIQQSLDNFYSKYAIKQTSVYNIYRVYIIPMYQSKPYNHSLFTHVCVIFE